MSDKIRIGYIGFGKMAKALHAGFATLPNVDIDSVLKTTKSDPTQSPQSVLTESDICVFAVKPQTMPEIWPLIKGRRPKGVCLSVMTGITISAFESALGPETPIIRSMPNTPCRLGSGMTAIKANDAVTDEQLASVIELLGTCGRIVQLEDEQLFDAVTAISGSGPAFFYRLSQDIVEVGKRHGLDEATALSLVSQTMIGAGDMLTNTPDPETLITEVRSPNGTTEAGLKQYNASNISPDIQSVIESAIKRSKDLSA